MIGGGAGWRIALAFDAEALLIETMKQSITWMVSLVCLVLASCTKEDSSDIETGDITLIATAEDGSLLDFVTVTPADKVERVIFEAPDDGSELRVQCVGSNRVPQIKKGMMVSTKKAKMFAGDVTADFKDGILQNVMGNGLHWGVSLDEAVLKQVRDLQASGKHTHLPTTVIVKKDRYRSKLVDDENGNLIPPNMTEAEKKFVETVVSAIRAKDGVTLKSLIHRPDGKVPTWDSGGDYLDDLIKAGCESYEFFQVDEDHPDGKELVAGDWSIPVKWILRVKSFEKVGVGPIGGSVSYVNEVGEADGRLMFCTRLPTTSE